MSYHSRSHLSRLRARAARPARGGLAGVSDLIAKPVSLPPMPTPGEPDEELKLLRRIAAADALYTENDVKLRYMQIGAIVLVPVFAGIWRFILGRRNIPSITG